MRGCKKPPPYLSTWSSAAAPTTLARNALFSLPPPLMMFPQMPPLILNLPNDAATARLGAALAPLLRRGDVLALDGDLGAGKTALARAALRAATGNPAEEVPSPTFTLVQLYDAPTGETWWHFDLYRLTTPEEALELGLEDALAEGISLIEWPQRLGAWLPQRAWWLRLEIAGPGRVATLQAPTAICAGVQAAMASRS